MTTIKSFFKWAQDSGLIDIDPAAGVKLPRALQGKAPTYMTLDETKALLESIKPGRYAKRDLVMLWCFAHGLRKAETAALNVADVIHPDDDAMPAIRVRGKGSKARTVPLGVVAYHAIQDYLDERGDAMESDPLLVCTYSGDNTRRMSNSCIQERFGLLASHADIPEPKRHPHAMRHGFATRMLFESNVPGGIYTVSKLLGHSRVSTTEIYLHCSNKRLEQAMLADPLGAGYS